jgi:N6-adenosine-specific RNA methylase IME4
MNKDPSILKSHPFNKIFGNLPQDEFESLKKDIATRGIQTIIDITEDDVIVCGHQRVRACIQLGIKEVPVRILKGWTDDKIKEHLIKDNILRRQLTNAQIADAGAELEKIYVGRQGGDRGNQYTGGKEAKETSVPLGKTTDLVAKDFGISGKTYERYKTANVLVKETKNDDLKKKWQQGKIKAGVIIRTFKKQEQKTRIENQKIKQPTGKFDVIVIDPPWNYTQTHDPAVHDKRGLTDYPQIPTEELLKLKLPHKDDCVLWLWTTNAFMKDAYKCLEAWGFQDKTILTWDKQFLGAGYWLRNITEHCILAIKGKPYFNNTKWTTLITEKRTTHSTKPEIFYKMVNEICAGKKLDYYARKKREGWEVYGDEI